ncbi:MAG: diacylglycerol kinase family lipid kinase [Anaerolineales bacterium]|nr:diacylglycerol kinase family lipid kinase [Chloroflexota bacterium]MBL6980728.1 diacylglycerol kinase family lipid kinase [Anaerolineales bacterium]
MFSALIVYNPAAGRFPSRILTERAANVLRSEGWEIHIEETQGGPHITQMAQQAVNANLDAFFTAGGDGSLNYAVKGLLGGETALGVLPAGTANVWAKELGLPDLTWTRWMALEESAKRLASANIREVDIGYCNGQPFLLWGGVGLDAFVIHRIEPRGRWEKSFAVAQYTANAIRQASLMGGVDIQVHTTDGEDIAGHYLLAVASNIHLYAGGVAEISPGARLDDGLMDLWLFSGDTWMEAITHAFDLMSGRHLKSDQTRCIPFNKVTLSSESPLYIQMDGEPFDESHEVLIEVLPKALRVMVPQKAPRALFDDMA